MTSTTKITGSLNLVSTTILDGLARVKQTQLADPEGTVYADTTYDGLGRVATGSNPYRSTGEVTYGLTTYNYDGLSRVTKVIPPDGTGTTNNVSTTYTGNCATVTDQAVKKRKSCADGLGRLSQVFEPNASGSFLYETDYQYDTLDNLTRVDQKGNDGNSANWRTRTFTYNSLAQLLTASNPESGTIAYTYDSDGNLATKVAPLPNQTGSSTVTITYGYDALHRLTGKTYSNGDPAVSYFYDQTSYNGLMITNGKGRRTGMSDASGATAWSYDSEGRPITEQRTISGFTKVISYTYNLDGSLASLTYPSGRVVNYAYNAAARPLSAIDTANGINYATAATYAPHGALAGVKYGVAGSFTGIVTSNTYNQRLQPVILSASAPSQTIVSFSYDFHLSVNNNGNVYAITNGLDGIRPNRPNGSAVYTYDQLNRIASAHTPGTTPDCTVMPSGLTRDWGQTFTVDIWSNLTNIAVERCSTPILNEPVNGKNQFIGANRFDAAGNEWENGQIVYDGEDRISTVVGVTYTYDGDGKRVKKSSGKLYWTGMGSDSLGESDLAGTLSAEYVFFGGKRMARLDLPSGVVHYYFSDHLGSHSVVTSANGGTIEQESDYYPFGGERAITTGPNNYRFTGKERDPESGLDYFGARYYGSSFGRFTSADPVAGRLSSPQSLNAYSYVRNNPLVFTDPTGMIVEWHDSKEKCKKGETECRTDAQRGYQDRLKQMRESKDKKTQEKGQRLTRAYERLQASKAVFEVTNTRGSGSNAGEIKYNGNDHFTINLHGNDPSGLSDNQRLAHEFEHGRQVLDGELSFFHAGSYWVPFAHDRSDEAKGFQAGFDIERAQPSQGSFLNDLQRQMDGGVSAGADALRNVGNYGALPKGPINVDYSSPSIYKVPQ